MVFEKMKDKGEIMIGNYFKGYAIIVVG